MSNQIKILIVDDNEGDIFLFKDSLEDSKKYLNEKGINIDFKISEVYNGVGAIEILEKNIFDIIFLDIKMPKMNGIECLKIIKEKKINSYIVMFTTSDYEEDIAKTYNLNANAYLLKSLDVMEFEENLKSILLLFIEDNFVYLNTIKNKYINYIKT